jgi:D-glycero-D-manno-heptose 1,7-bisphosphate phosphatase
VKVVFLDRDGVINENRADHVKSWDEVRFLPGALEAIARLTRAGLKVFIVTNQAIVNRGIVTHDTIDAINRRMVHEIQRRGGRIDGVAYCPHRPDESCACRKPEPGLLLHLADRHRFDPRESMIIGDALNDVAAGLSAGAHAILVLTGRGCKELTRAPVDGRYTFQVAIDLGDAVDRLLSGGRSWW